MRIFLSNLILFLTFSASAQVLQPVKWSYNFDKVGADEFELKMTASIDDGWTIYSQHTEDDGPVPTSFEFEKGAHFETIGIVEEKGKKKEGHDPLFDTNVIKFVKGPVVFTQKVKVNDYSKPIKGYLTFMTCDNARCLPPTDVDFSFSLPGNATPPATAAATTAKPTSPAIKKQVPGDIAAAAKKQAKKLPAIPKAQPKKETAKTTEIPVDLKNKAAAKAKQKAAATSAATTDAIPKTAATTETTDQTEQPKLAEQPAAAKKKTMANGSVCSSFVIEGNKIDQQISSIRETYAAPLGDCGGEAESEDKSLLLTFILGFLGGLVALLTPCVFPMIPLTVSYFTKSSKDRATGIRNALWYGASIIIIYVTIGLLVTAFLGPEALNIMATHWIPNLLFFIIFVVFAFSFFGYFEITLPSSWTSKTDRAADQGGLIGIFFMAFTLALVSFSCTGPIIGSALVESATNKLGPFIVMLGFSSALALPFALFAAFPGWLNSLPRSGGWMTSVKVVLGFLELALAFKFLSTADLTEHWGVLPYELFMGLWVIISLATAAYLFGMFKFPHDGPMKKLSPVRGTFALLFLGMAIYLSTGFMKNTTTGLYSTPSLVSGIAPPANYNIFIAPVEAGDDASIKERYPSFGKCANNIDCFKDYCEGLAYAREVKKPLFVDFTGHGCQNCRKVEDGIWVTDEVRNQLQNDFVLVSLYVDDRKKLPEVFVSKNQGTKLRNVGNKWADFQIVNFDQNSQPLYVMMTTDEKVMARPISFEGTDQDDIDRYNEYLECGLATYGSLK